MLSTYLAVYPWLAPLMIVTAVVVGPLLGWGLTRTPRLARAITALSVVLVLAATLYPTGRQLEAGCTFELEWSFLAPEPLANVVLFVPVALLLGVVTRAPLLGAIVGIVLSAAIETTQAFFPAIGRSCDAMDWTSNSAGAILGGLLAALALLLARRRDADDEAHHAQVEAQRELR